jgi:glucosamine--fructose-6-phosphate aminotransferase (isomerizing)
MTGTPAAPVTSAMAREAATCGEAAARLLASRPAIHALAGRLDTGRARVAVICGRGSSGHAGVHLRYLIETRLGLPVSMTAPSVITALQRPLKLDGALFIVISQSGASPDLIAATRMARAEGAQTVAMVNAEGSPLADAADHVLPLLAGAERAVAATKSVTSSMMAGALLVAGLSGDAGLMAALERLPARLDLAHACDWTALAPALAKAPSACITGRAFGLAPAREIALKLTEMLRIPALGYSAAELLHGPRAALSSQTPVLAIRLYDRTGMDVDNLVTRLRGEGVPVFVCGGRSGDLPWIGDDDPVTDAIAMLAPAYRLIEAAARARGFDPDHPPHLSKVTRTL